ncbi:MAG: glycosyltransferase family 4 protein [Planctomycetota bacterium]
MSTHKIVYMAFDRFPAPKGAAVHIAAFVEALGQAFGETELLTVAVDAVGPGQIPPEPCQIVPGVRHQPLPVWGPNIIERVLAFRAQLMAWWQSRWAEIVHVRSIFEGYPIARDKARYCNHFVFEVNGLPSIELKYHYPDVADDAELLHKLTRQEQLCIDAADLLLTPSPVTAEYLLARGAPVERIRVIPNGVDADLFSHQPPRLWDSRPIKLIYTGTMTAWQGVSQLIDALALYHRDHPAELTLIGPTRARQRRELLDRCYKSGVSEAVELLPPVSQAELVQKYHQADVAIVPLMPNDRNLVQGCCPLKVIEAMSAGTPVVASDLPVVTILARPDTDALLVRPGSAKAIKDALLALRADPELPRRLSMNARARVEREMTWKQAQQALVAAYEELPALARASTCCSAVSSARG